MRHNCGHKGAEMENAKPPAAGATIAKIETPATRGADLINAERVRQTAEEGFDATHVVKPEDL